MCLMSLCLLVQGDSDESTLTPFGEEQAKRTAAALSKMQFDRYDARDGHLISAPSS